MTLIEGWVAVDPGSVRDPVSTVPSVKDSGAGVSATRS
jgi:hypothetical protein